jgi:hypothetical protein
MNRWLSPLRFLWEEEIALPEEVPRGNSEEPAGVPRLLRAATRFALIGVAATSLLSQVVGVRLMAPVDASPSYAAQCRQSCQNTLRACQNNCPKGKSGTACKNTCSTAFNNCQTGCNTK